MQHKLGPCPISDVSIAIVISSAHRKDSLEAVHFMIDELKDKVPIWKKVHCASSYVPITVTDFHIINYVCTRSITVKESPPGKITQSIVAP